MRFSILIILILLFSCGSDKYSLKEYAVGLISIAAKDKSTLSELKGIDTYVAKLKVDKDTFHIEYGKGIYKLNEPSPTIFPFDQKENIEKLSGTRITEANEVRFSETAEEDREQNIFSKQYYLYDTINGIIAKIVQPKKIGDGVTGLYIYKLKDGNSLSIYAKNLDSSSHLEALQMFRTIKYYKTP